MTTHKLKKGLTTGPIRSTGRRRSYRRQRGDLACGAHPSGPAAVRMRRQMRSVTIGDSPLDNFVLVAARIRHTSCLKCLRNPAGKATGEWRRSKKNSSEWGSSASNRAPEYQLVPRALDGNGSIGLGDETRQVACLPASIASRMDDSTPVEGCKIPVADIGLQLPCPVRATWTTVEKRWCLWRRCGLPMDTKDGRRTLGSGPRDSR